MKNNQNGLTLTEVLAVIVITSIVMLLIWRIFFQGTAYSNESISKSLLQQEANVIVSELKQIHRMYTSYTVKVENCGIEIEGVLKGNAESVTLNNTKMCLTLIGMPIDTEIKPANNNSINFTIKITDKVNLKDINQPLTDANLIDNSKLIQIDSSLYKIGGNAR